METAQVRRPVVSVWGSEVVLLLAVAAVLWPGFDGRGAIAEPGGRRRIEVTEPGEYSGTNCMFFMTKDTTSEGTGFTFDGKNYVVDLGWHTLTFNTRPYEPVFPVDISAGARLMFTPPWGVLLKGENVELRNGTVVQGPGQDSQARCVFVRATKVNIHDTTTVISGGDRGRNFYAKWAGAKVELHHNYLVNRAHAERGWYGAITLFEAGTDWDVHHNTICGGHQGILVGGRRDSEGVRVHHNWISHRRTRGQKVPQGIYIRASGCEIDHNEIVTVDGRGLEPTGENNHWHDNIVDIRYTSKASGGFYPENRCYGYWARNPNGNVVDNLFVVNNEVVGDRSSNAVGVLLVTDPGRDVPLRNCTVSGNRLFISHHDKQCPAWGIMLGHVGDQVVVRNNSIWAKTSGVMVRDSAKGAVVENNTFYRTGDQWEMVSVWGGGTGAGVRNCTFKNNRTVDLEKDQAPPTAPRGLSVIRRINGYELHWEPNSEEDVLGYYVYRDGQRVEDRRKCGRFYIDTEAAPTEAHAYSVSAVDISGNEGPKCEPVSTRNATGRRQTGGSCGTPESGEAVLGSSRKATHREAAMAG